MPIKKAEQAAKAQLTLELIARTAIEIADEHGFEAVSMRRVAEALNVGTMSLYHYVPSKVDLVAAIDDLLMGEILLPVLPKSWKRALTDIAHKTFQMHRQHPWALVAMISAPPGLNALRHMEQCLEALAGTAMTARDKLTLLTTIDDLVFGHVLRTASTAARPDRAFARQQVATGAFPHLGDVMLKIGDERDEGRLDKGLKALLDAAHKSQSSRVDKS